MIEFDSLALPDSVRVKLDGMGIVTLRILKSEISAKIDVSQNLGIMDDEAIEILWNIVQNGQKCKAGLSVDEESDSNENEGMEQEGAQNAVGNVVDTLHGYMLPMSAPRAPVSAAAKAF